MFLLYLSQHINSNIGREIGPLVLERRRCIDFTVNNRKLFKSSVTLKVVHMPHVNLSELPVTAFEKYFVKKIKK